MQDRAPTQPPSHPSGLRLAGLLVALLGALPACSPDASATTSSAPRAEAPEDVQRDVLDLISAVTPPAPTLGPIEKNSWFSRRRDLLKRLRGASHAHGLEALRMYQERAQSLPEIRVGLLDVAAHAAPEETRPFLVELVTEYGDDLLVRTEATTLLGETSPETALEVLGPILRGELPGRTYPPEDRMLEAWNTAALATGLDRAPLLADIATDLSRDQSVRHYATKLLGETPGPRGRQALELLLVESSGNQYIRRVAAQSLRNTLPPEELCDLLRRTIERETDGNFLIFLDNMVQENCR